MVPQEAGRQIGGDNIVPYDRFLVKQRLREFDSGLDKPLNRVFEEGRSGLIEPFIPRTFDGFTEQCVSFCDSLVRDQEKGWGIVPPGGTVLISHSTSDNEEGLYLDTDIKLSKPHVYGSPEVTSMNVFVQKRGEKPLFLDIYFGSLNQEIQGVEITWDNQGDVDEPPGFLKDLFPRNNALVKLSQEVRKEKGRRGIIIKKDEEKEHAISLEFMEYDPAQKENKGCFFADSQVFDINGLITSLSKFIPDYYSTTYR